MEYTTKVEIIRLHRVYDRTTFRLYNVGFLESLGSVTGIKKSIKDGQSGVVFFNFGFQVPSQEVDGDDAHAISKNVDGQTQPQL